MQWYYQFFYTDNSKCMQYLCSKLPKNFQTPTSLNQCRYVLPSRTRPRGSFLRFENSTGELLVSLTPTFQLSVHVVYAQSASWSRGIALSAFLSGVHTAVSSVNRTIQIPGSLGALLTNTKNRLSLIHIQMCIRDRSRTLRCTRRSRTFDVAGSRLMGRMLPGREASFPCFGITVTVALRHFWGKQASFRHALNSATKKINQSLLRESSQSGVRDPVRACLLYTSRCV